MHADNAGVLARRRPVAVDHRNVLSDLFGMEEGAGGTCVRRSPGCRRVYRERVGIGRYPSAVSSARSGVSRNDAGSFETIDAVNASVLSARRNARAATDSGTGTERLNAHRGVAIVSLPFVWVECVGTCEHWVRVLPTAIFADGNIGPCVRCVKRKALLTANYIFAAGVSISRYLASHLQGSSGLAVASFNSPDDGRSGQRSRPNAADVCPRSVAGVCSAPREQERRRGTGTGITVFRCDSRPVRATVQLVCASTKDPRPAGRAVANGVEQKRKRA